MRLAWFSPWPPQTSGIAGRSAELTSALAARGAAIDVFVDRRFVPAGPRASDDGPGPAEVRVQSAHDFVWRHHRGQYDLAIYQLGNSTAHEFIWPYLLRYPGLAVLHDAHLHHARGAALIGRESAAVYRAGFAFDHPDVPLEAAELAVAGFDGSYHFLWPMLRSVVLASRAVGVHARGAAHTLQEAWPDTVIEYVALGSGRDQPFDEAAAAEIRAGLGIRTDAMLFGVFGGLTAEKRLLPILRAFASVATVVPEAHLLLAGAPDRRLDLPAVIGTLGLTSRVTLAPDLDDELFERAVAAVDVSLNLRWPTARETSGPWLQALAAARPTVVVELAHQVHVPALDPQTWLPRPTAVPAPPITIALDIVDEEHSLRAAMLRLAHDASLRAELGAAGRRYWEREHSMERMTEDYMRLIARAIDVPAVSRLPAAALADARGRARERLAAFGPLVAERTAMLGVAPAWADR